MTTQEINGAVPAGGGPPEDDTRTPLQCIADALRGLRYGTVTVIVQDGVVVQVERTEKRRLPRGGRKV